MRSGRIILWLVVYAMTCMCAMQTAFATVLYSESVMGDLSDNKASPTPLTLAIGTNSIVGALNNNTGDGQDWFALTVPAGMQMNSYVNAAYTGAADNLSFTGFQVGSSFAGSVSSAGSFAGYAQFGTNAMNSNVNGDTPTTTVGVDLLTAPHYMSDNGVGGTAAGATGYTAPLGAGTYTFLVQRSGNGITYQFDIGVSAVPEPGTFCLASLGLGMLVLWMMGSRQG